MDFRPLNETERRHLITALRGNAQDGLAVLMDRRTPASSAPPTRCPTRK